MNKRPFEWKRDGGGLVLFVAGAFVSTLMVMALRAEQPLDQIAGSAAIAWPFVNTFGAFPCLVLAAGVGFLGARAFLTASEAGVLRHTLGLIGCTLGFSILFGAFSDTGGGRFGLFIGGGFGAATHATLGGLLGLAVWLAAVWFAWLREAGTLYAEQIRSSVRDRAEVADPGVTAAEAAGLIPEELPPVALATLGSTYAVLTSAPRSPYPEDVRLKGQVPAGARPIETANTAHVYPAAPRVSPGPLPKSSLERTQPFHPGANLAAPASSAVPFAAPATGKVRALPPGAQPLEPADEELTERDLEPVPSEEMRLESAPARPSWEQTGLGEDDEPVDAYGTPLSLVESLRKAREELLAIPESTDAETEALLEPLADAEEFEPAVPVFSGSDDEVEDDLVEKEIDDDDEETDEDEEEDDEDEDEEKDEEEEEVELFVDDEEARDARTPVAAGAPQELDQAVLAEAEELAAEDELVEIVEELVPVSELEAPLVEPKAIAQTTIFDFTGDTQAGVELFPEGLPEAALAREPLEEHVSEFSSEHSTEMQAGPQGEIEIEIGEEPEVILQPQAAPAERAHKSLSVDPLRAKLLAEAGCLFVERGRVAVSMLQRQYGMDFDDACKVLDELQDLGLIGPYLGGQSRDILLTRDQWLEKAGAF